MLIFCEARSPTLKGYGFYGSEKKNKEKFGNIIKQVVYLQYQF